MDSGLDDFQSLPFLSGCGFDPSSRYRLLLVFADANLPIIYSCLSIDPYYSYIYTFNIVARYNVLGFKLYSTCTMQDT